MQSAYGSESSRPWDTSSTTSKHDQNTYGDMMSWSNNANYIICTLVQVGDWRKYALEENNMSDYLTYFIKFKIVMYHAITVLSGNINTRVV